MNNQDLFSSKDKSKELKCRLLQFLFSALRVKNKSHFGRALSSRELGFVALLFYVHGKHHKVMSGRSVNLTTLFLGRLRPPKRLTSTSCTYFRQ